MNRDQDNDSLVDLGAATEETKGTGTSFFDAESGLKMHVGLSDD